MFYLIVFMYFKINMMIDRSQVLDAGISLKSELILLRSAIL
jgi:hypothetical protein